MRFKKCKFYLSGVESAEFRRILQVALDLFGVTLMTKIDEKIAEFGATVSAQFDRMGTAIDGVVSDVSWLKSEIEKLSDVDLSEEAQTILDGISARVAELADKAEALDGETTPVVPQAE